MRSSWILDCKDSARCLLDSWDSTRSPNIDCFELLFLPLLFITFVMLGWTILLHGMPGAMGLSSSLLAFLRISEYSLSSGSLNWIPLSFWALSSFGFSFAHSCFSRFWAAFPILLRTSSHTWSRVVWTFCESPSGPHVPFWRLLFQLRGFLNPFQESDKRLLESTFQWSSIRYYCMMSRSVWVDLVTTVYFSGIGNVSSYST